MCRPRTRLGNTPKLSYEEQLCMTLTYFREYRSQYHLGVDYGLSESNVCRTIQKIENKLMRSGKFSLSGGEHECIVVDATEQEIERPKRRQRIGHDWEQVDRSDNNEFLA